jgi:hypothetical protein
MPRLHIFEIHDYPWCPPSLRDALTDFLEFTINLGRSYAAIVPMLRDAIVRSGATSVLDLCSGAGGPWRTIGAEMPVPVLLSDKFPNRAATMGAVPFHPRAVDAAAVPADLPGFRTIFTAFITFGPRRRGRFWPTRCVRGRGSGCSRSRGAPPSRSRSLP